MKAMATTIFMGMTEAPAGAGLVVRQGMALHAAGMD
jgi:hypothetical protein